MMKEHIVICMPVRNAENTLRNAIASVLSQKNTKRDVVLLLGNDNSNDGTQSIINDFSSNKNIISVNVNFGKTSEVRNFLNNYARENVANCALIGRLDSDDVLCDEFTISKIETLYEKYNFDVLICGNQQSKDGKILEWKNHPSIQLLDDKYLLNRLREMAKDNPKAELPSCNTFIKPFIRIDYPEMQSAEDHWLTVLLLLQKDKLSIHIDEELLYCIYSLDGLATMNNQKSNIYLESRLDLYNYFKKAIGK